MKRSLLRVNKTLACFLLVLVVLSPAIGQAQSKPQIKKEPTSTTTGKAGQVGTKADGKSNQGKKKVKHKRHTEIKHHSDDDKKLEQIKAEKNKQKGVK